ncbi:MAG: sulfate adenylyltransferase small subunit, partial [Gordonia sp. (in: high G+C Gram-positive bacteria)]
MRVARLMSITESTTDIVSNDEFTTLDALESESIHIFREVAGE